MAKAVALNHHQTYAGTGYPKIKNGTILDPTKMSLEDYLSAKDSLGLTALSKDEVPMVARIVALADIYDALRTNRSYKPGFSHEKAVDLLDRDDRTKLTGQQRFGQVYDTFRASSDEIGQMTSASYN